MRGKLLKDEEEYKVWLVWKMVGDRPVLVAIDTSEEKAERHVSYDKLCDSHASKPPADYYVEDSLLNHLYGQSINDTEASFRISKVMQRNKRT